MANNTCARPPALYQGNGSTTKYSFAFPYIETSDIAVFLWNETTETFDLCTQVSNSAACSGSTTEYYFTSATPVDLTFCVAPPEPPENRPDWFSNVIIIRQTDICQMVAYFYPGSPVRAQDLNNNFTQILLALQDVEGRLVQFIENYQGFVRITGDTMEGGPLDMNTFQLTGVPDPVDGTDAVPLDWAENQYINADGDTMRGTLNMNGNDLTGVPYPSVDSDAANKKYVDDLRDYVDDEIEDLDDELRDWAEDTFVNVTGDRMTGELQMSNNKIREVGNPLVSGDAVNKQYVDEAIWGGGGEVQALPVSRTIYNAVGGETLITANTPFSQGNEIITVNGSTITPTDDYTYSGNKSINLRLPLLKNDQVMILSYNNLATYVIDSNFGTFPFTRWVETATAGQTVFEGTGDGSVTLAYSVGFEQVALNGAVLQRDVDYIANNKTTVTLTQPTLESDVVVVTSANYIKNIEVSANFDTVPYSRWVKIATSGQTSFSGLGEDYSTLAYSVGSECVYFNGSLLTRNIDYTAVDKTTVTLTQPAQEGDVIDIHSANYIKTV